MQDLVETIKKLSNNIAENTRLLRGIDNKLSKPEYLSLPKAAKVLRINEFSLRAMCEKGEIPCTLTPGSKVAHHWLIDIRGAREALNNRDLNNLRRK